MSIKAIGTFTNALKSVGTSADGIRIAGEAISGFSTNAKIAAISASGLSEAEMIVALRASGMTDAEVQAAIATLQMSTAQGTAIGTTSGLSAVMSGLWNVLKANPLILVIAGITAGITAWNAYKRSTQEALDSAREAGSSWSDSNTNVQSQIDRIVELRTQLASGTLTEEEAYTAKSELLSIQQQLTESYGAQAENINLVNGSLEEQIGLLNSLSQADAQRFLNENRKPIAKAEKELSKNIGGTFGLSLGSYFRDNQSVESGLVNGILGKGEYKDFIQSSTNWDGSVSIKFVGNAEQAYDVLNNLITDASNAKEQLAESGELDTGILDSITLAAEDGLKEAGSLLDEYQDLANQAADARLIADQELYSYGNKNQYASEWIKDYTSAVQEYNEAIASGDTSQIEVASKNFDEVSTAIQSLIANTGMSDYADQVSEIGAQLSLTALQAIQFKDALNGVNTEASGSTINDELGNIIKDANLIKDANISDIDFKVELENPDRSFSYDFAQDLPGAILRISSAATEAGLTTDQLIELLVELGIVSSSSGEEVADATQDAADSMALLDKALGEGFGEQISTYQKQLETLKDALEDLQNGELTDAEVFELMKEFPGLTEYADDLGTGIQNMMLEIIGSSEDGTGALGLFENKIQELGESTPGGQALAVMMDYFKGLYTETNDNLDDAMKGNFGERLDSYKGQLDTLKEALEQFNEGELTDEDAFELMQEFPELADNADDLGTGISKMMKKIIGSTEDGTGVLGLFDKQLEALGGDKQAVNTLRALRDAFLELYEAKEKDDYGLSSQKEVTSSFLTGVSNIQSVLSGQSTGQSISIEDFNSEEMKEYRSALEYVNGTMQLNVDKVNEIIKAKAEEQVAVNKSNKALAQEDYLKNARDIEKYRQKIEEATNETQKLRWQDQINQLRNENDALLETCKSYDVMTSAIEVATGAYQNWINAQNASQSGDMFDSALTALEKINDTLNDTESESYGRVGNEDYKAALGLVIPDSVDTEDKDAVRQYMDSIADLFTWDDEGNRTGLDITRFCEKAIDAGLMTLDESTNQYRTLGAQTMQEFADGLGLSLPLVQAMFGEMEEFGAEFDWSNGAMESLEDFGVAAYESAEALREIEGNEDLKIVLDVSEFEDKELAIETLDSTIQEMNDLKAKPGVDASEIEHANNVIEYCVMQKQALNAPAVMQVDTSQVVGEVGEAIGLLQQFQEAKNSIEMQAAIGADTSGAEQELNGLVSQIQGLSPEVKASLGINDTDITTITSSIEALTPEMMVKAGVDQSLVDTFLETSHDQQSNVIYQVQDGKVRSYDPPDKNATVNYSPVFDTKTPVPTLHGEVVYVRRFRNASEGEGSLNGTAHANGTAYIGGNWGTATGGKTLVGELGREIVVDPHNGKWYTVGDNGAEFVNIPKNSIVFNHLQSESLLKNGYAVGRAAALASGTAMVDPGFSFSIDVDNANNSNPHNYPTNNNPGTTYTKPQSSTSSTSSQQQKQEKEKVDWIETAISRIERLIERLRTKAENIYNTFSTRNKALKKEISEVSAEIKLQQEAYKRYKQEADSVGLSADLQKKVQNGTIDISSYDENTSAKITEYQEWYEKMLACSDSILELKNNLAELYQQKFDNVVARWSGTIEEFTHKIEHTDNVIDQRNEASTEYTSFSSRRKTSKRNIKDYKSQVKTAQKELKAQQKQHDELVKVLNEGVKSGSIPKGSEGYNEMLKQIHDSENEIDNLNSDIIKYTNSITEEYRNMFDSIYDEYTAKVQNLEHDIEHSQNLISQRSAKANEYSSYSSRRKASQENINDYSDLIKDAKSEIKIKKKQKKELEKALKQGMDLEGNPIEKGSEGYYDMLDQIQSTEDEIDGLNSDIINYSNSIQDEYKNMFDTIYSEYVDKVQKLEHDIEHSQNMISQRSAAANEFAGYTERREASRQNIVDYRGLIKDTQKEIGIKEEEKKKLEEALAQGVDANGKPIKKGTEGYNEMLKQIQGVESEIDGLNNDIINYSNSIQEEYRNLFDSVYNQYENKIKDLEHDLERAQSRINRRSEYASEFVGYDESRNASQQNITDYQGMIANAQAQVEKRKKERLSLIDTLNKRVAAGEIEEGSEAYYSMLQTIQAVENEIDSLNSSIISYSNQISEEYKNMFNSVSQEYSNKLKMADHLSTQYNNSLETAEAMGYMASTKYYEMMRDQQETNIAILQQELSELTSALYSAVASGEIQVGSAAWYEMSQEICNVSDQIDQAKKSVIEFNNSIREIEWERFDYMVDEISKLKDESDFLIELLSYDDLIDDNGELTKEGLSTVGLHGMNYNTLMLQADEYAKEIEKINAEIANDPNNTKLLERRDELIQKQRESILAAEQEKQAIKDLVEEGIQEELNSFSELIDKYKDLLDAQKDLHDYQKQIEDQAKHIADLQKQLSAYENDISEETQAKVQQLKVELEEAKDEMAETEYDKYIDDQKKLLDDLYDEYEKTLNERFDDLDRVIDEMIVKVNENAGVIGQTLSAKAESVGTQLSSDMRSVWEPMNGSINGIKDVLAAYSANFSDKATTLNSTVEGIKERVEAIAEAADQRAEDEKQRLELEKQRQEEDERRAKEEAEANGGGTKGDALDAANDNLPTTDQNTLPDNGTTKPEPEKPTDNNPPTTDTNPTTEDKTTTQQEPRIDKNKVMAVIHSGKPHKGKITADEMERHHEVWEYITDKYKIQPWGDDYYERLADALNITLKNPKDMTKQDKNNMLAALKKNGFAKGGYVDSYIPADPRTAAGRAVISNGDKGFVSVAPGEYILSKRQTDQFLSVLKPATDTMSEFNNAYGSQKFGSVDTISAYSGRANMQSALTSERLWAKANNPGSFVTENLRSRSANYLPTGGQGTNEINQDIGDININIDEVADLDDLLAQMQKSKGFERLVQAITIDPLLGKSVEQKRRFNFNKN